MEQRVAWGLKSDGEAPLANAEGGVASGVGRNLLGGTNGLDTEGGVASGALRAWMDYACMHPSLPQEPLVCCKLGLTKKKKLTAENRV